MKVDHKINELPFEEFIKNKKLVPECTNEIIGSMLCNFHFTDKHGTNRYDFSHDEDMANVLTTVFKIVLDRDNWEVE